MQTLKAIDLLVMLFSPIITLLGRGYLQNLNGAKGWLSVFSFLIHAVWLRHYQIFRRLSALERFLVSLLNSAHNRRFFGLLDRRTGERPVLSGG